MYETVVTHDITNCLEWDFLLLSKENTIYEYLVSLKIQGSHFP